MRVQRGTALLVVMVVVVMMALAAYGFVYMMQTEYSSVSFAREHAQAREACLSGQDYGLLWAGLSRGQRQSQLQASSKQDLFAAISLERNEFDELTPGWSFSLLSPTPGQLGNRGWQFGLVDESSKLNLNALRQWDEQSPGHASVALSALPGISEFQVGQILNALGLPSQGSQTQGESLELENSPANSDRRSQFLNTTESGNTTSVMGVRTAPVRSLTDLVFSGSVGYEQMWGSDHDRNYLDDQFAEAIKTVEDEYADLFSTEGPRPEDFSGETLEMGSPWRDLLTFHSAEKNLTHEGQPRIWINHPSLSELQQKLLEKWPSEWVEFLLAYRQYGPADESFKATSSASGWVADLSVQGTVPIESVFDLVGATVAVPVSSGGQAALNSPFQEVTNEPSSWIHALLDDITVSEKTVLSGRVNVLLATPEVLSAVPGIEASLAQAIVQKRGEIQGSPEDQRSVGWLLGHQLVDLSTMERLAPYLTMGGNVYSGQVVGFRDDYSAFYRCTAILSAVGQPRALQIERWHAWGRGFQSIELRQGAKPQDALEEASGL